nr:hypothetical protein Itr_chr08CG15000 [Ipomoea trifida]
MISASLIERTPSRRMPSRLHDELAETKYAFTPSQNPSFLPSSLLLPRRISRGEFVVLFDSLLFVLFVLSIANWGKTLRDCVLP